VTYTNLPGGTYTFRVKASNNQGKWNDQGTSIRIIITPPFWKTIWFYGLLLIVIGGIAYWVYQWRVQARDLEAQRRMEAALTKERNLLRTLIDNLPDYISIKDIEGRFVVANMAVVHQIGFNSTNELIGKSDYDLFPRELAERYFADEQKIIQSGQGLYEFEGPTIDKSKAEKDRWVTTIKVPLRDAQEKIISTVSISRDITERKKAEAEREKLITQLQDALADVKLLSGLVPICANCKKIRDDQGYWTQIESYIQDHSDARFSHSICPDCAAKLYSKYLPKK
jgi:PAS domain S-box-containing protein